MMSVTLWCDTKCDRKGVTRKAFKELLCASVTVILEMCSYAREKVIQEVKKMTFYQSGGRIPESVSQLCTGS